MSRGRGIWALALLLGAVGLAAGVVLQAANLGPHYELDEPTPADDLSTANLDGTLTGAPPTSTDVPAPITAFSSHSLDVGPGSAGEQYLQTPGAAPLGNLQTASYTVMAWFKPNAVGLPVPDDQQAVVMKAGNHEGIYWTGAGVFAMEHWLTSNNGMADTVRATTAGTWGYPSFALGAWYHVAGVVDTASGHTRVYVHPASGAAATVSTTTWASTPWGAETIVSHGVGYQAGQPWRVGVALPGSATIRWHADGLVDDVRFYNRALSQAEIAAVAAGTDQGAATAPAPPPAPPAPPAPPPPPRTNDHSEGLLNEKCACGSACGLPLPWTAAAVGLLAAALVALKRRP